ncbi:MAG: nucleoside triphosphate pyrophosphohydrolase [Chloroflexi bacterium]|nr:nucleoside triphosphate pyrophosphohydrolase [Chloroflexota bacterium]
MQLLKTLSHLEPALRALGLADSAGLQLYQARHLSTFHHPPFNPDLPVLVALEAGVDMAQIGRVLLNQYAAEHPLHLVSANAPEEVTALTVGDMAEIDASPKWNALIVHPLSQAGSFERFQETIAHLRAPEGCPWDRKQTHTSLRPYLLEETYEVLDALDSGNSQALREELGDLLLQIVLHSQIAVDEGTFRMTDIIAAINAKLVHRHPHVWGDVQVDDEEDVKSNWDKLKQQEKNDTRQSRLDGVPKSLPALSQAFSYQDRAARVNFDWETIDPVLAKVQEEIDELLSAPDEKARAQEAGDLLFAVVNLARWLDVEPESALRGTNARFYQRFHYIEQQAAAQGREVSDMSLAEMDTLWDAAKANGL